MLFENPLLLIFPVAMILAAVMDMLTLTISNRLNLFIIGAFCFVAPVSGMPLALMADHAMAFGLVLVFGIVLFAFRLVGGGDAKLLPAAALWLGFDQVVPFIFNMAFLGGLLAASFLAYRSLFPVGAFQIPNWAYRLHSRDCGIPYGIAISGAALHLYPVTIWFTGF